MPWSDWIDNADEVWNVFDRAQVGTTSNGEASGPHGTPASTLLPIARDQAMAFSGAISQPTSGAGAFQSLLYQQYSDDFSSEGAGASAVRGIGIAYYNIDGYQRTTFPALLYTLTYGVDYVENPTTGDIIEYEDGTFEVLPSDVLGWLAAGTLTVTAAGKLSGPLTFSGRSAVIDDAPPPTTVDIDPPITVTPGSGTTVAEVDGPAGTSATGSISLGAGVSSWRLLTEGFFDNFGDDPDLPTGKVEFAQGVKLSVHLPRWRYWKPEPDVVSHVRLLHRGDGLGMSPRRLRTGGTTNQSGRLRGSY